jgi:glycosyltransferase involved in cell wall biosynthesis
MKQRLGIIGSINCIHLRRYLETIDHSLYEVTVISWEPPSFSADTRQTFFIGAEQFGFFKTIKRLWVYFNFIKRCNFDFVHCFGALSPISWLGGIACSSVLTTSVIGADIFLEEQLEIVPPVKASTINLLRMSDRVFFLSLAMKEKLTDVIKLSKDSIQEDFLLVSDKWRDYLVPSPSRNNQYPVIFSPRMLSPLYRQYELIEVMGRIKMRYPNVCFMQTGYCPNLEYKERCQHLVEKLGLSDNVIFMPSLHKEEDLIDIYDQSDIVIMIPKSDGLPSSLIEAWWRKRPVIVSDIYNYEESWNRKFFVKTPIDIDTLSDCIENILSSHKTREHITNAAFDFVSKKSFSQKKRFEDIRIKKRFFRKIYGFFLFILFLLEPHFSKLIKKLRGSP